MRSIYDIRTILDQQESFFLAGGTRSLEFRRSALLRLQNSVQKHEEDLLEALETDLGKPAVEAYLAEVYFVVSEIRYVRKHLHRWSKPVRASNPIYSVPAKSEVRREPYGRSLILAPWNYPVQLCLGPLISSVAAGNCVVVKPSELSPASSAVVAKIVRKTFDPAHVAVFEGGKEVAQTLLEQAFDFFFYTGSEKVGRIVSQAASNHLAPCVLELGGKCPCIVDEDVNLDRAAERIAVGKFFNGGQTCMAPDFVVAHRSIREELVRRIANCVKEWYGEEGYREDLAHIVNERHYERINRLVTGEKIEIGKDDAGRLRMAPKILPKVNWEHPSMQQEIFGPVLPVLEFADIDELLKKFRGEATPLSLYVFSRSEDFREKVAQAIPSGSVCFNDTMKQATNLELPFGGVGTSGMGRYRGRYGFETFSRTRSYMRRYFLKDLMFLHPPYDGMLKKIKSVFK